MAYLPVIILMFLLSKVQSLTCPRSTPKCGCYDEYMGIEIHCPRADSQIQIKVSQDDNVDIECINDNTYFDISMVPEFDAYLGKKFSLKYCEFNNTISDILSKFNMTDVERISLEQWGTGQSPHITISRDMFEGLDEVTFLSIAFSNPKFENDFLESMTNLRTMQLNKNGLKAVNWSFQSVPNLEQLDLSRNDINVLPDGIFNNLNKLRVLHLWGNNIANLHRNTFAGLSDLELLELYSNNVTILPEDVFSDFSNLVNLSLRSNKLKEIYSDTFKNSIILQNIRLGFNDIEIVGDYVLSNFTHLKTVELNNNKLKSIPEHIFTDSVALEEIKLQNNNLESLPSQVFEGLKNLRKLDLSNNKLSSINDQLFLSLQELKTLGMHNNRIVELTKDIFAKTNKLESLDISDNIIKTIDLGAFNGVNNCLTDLDISNNQYVIDSSNADNNAVLNCLNIRRLNLNHNNITEIPSFLSWTRIEKLDLAFNQIKTISISDYLVTSDLVLNVSNNDIWMVDFANTELTIHQNPKNTFRHTQIDVRNNPIQCNCKHYELVQYINKEMPDVSSLIDIKLDNLRCANDEDILVEELKPLDVFCSSDPVCSKDCACSYRQYDKAAIVDCSYRNLTSYPELFQNNGKVNYNQTVLLLSGNQLTEGPSESAYYQNVTYMDLSGNKINRLTWVPSKIKELNLEDNHLKVISSSFVKLLNNATSLQRLLLKDNPWTCKCDALDFQKYLMQYYHKVNTTDIYCDNDHKILLVKKTELCKASMYLTIILPLVLFVLLCFSVMIAIYYRYQNSIKIYLYTKNLCLWLVTEEELDKDKDYDVFVSYSNEDAKLVEEHLLPELEQGEYPFKVCIHFRDWIAGDPIPEQIERSVKNSRRTLVVLTNHFVNSVWGTLEFRTAHTEAMSEGRARVIVVIVGDVNEEKLDDELKSYLKTNTYVKWGDRYFWNKLRYALPHSNKKLHSKNRKMMLKIDDKFNLVHSSPNHTSTPPIIIDSSHFLGGLDKKSNIPKKLDGEISLLV